MFRSFDPTFLGLWKICMVLTPIFENKIEKMSYFDRYVLSKFDKVYNFDPPCWPFVAFRANGAEHLYTKLEHDGESSLLALCEGNP